MYEAMRTGLNDPIFFLLLIYFLFIYFVLFFIYLLLLLFFFYYYYYYFFFFFLGGACFKILMLSVHKVFGCTSRTRLYCNAASHCVQYSRVRLGLHMPCHHNIAYTYFLLQLYVTNPAACI